MNALQGLQLRDAMTMTGSTAEPEQKRAGVTGHTEKPASLHSSQAPFFRLGTLET